ncbi:MAG: NAD(P)H-dependent oxidoreductase subunit E [Candidatus Sumerlaeota bacterium]|nr:NAD(P)H-dependent oxidoreductase subunit E [Candidatus Sumerlaeota bacterium]
MPEVMDREEIGEILEKHNGARGSLIATLEEIQARCGYLPEEALRAVVDGTGRSLVDVYGVATFYRSFSLQPRGRHLITVCLGTACHVRGGPMVVEEFERRLEIRAGETTPDREFTLQRVNCLGACALGPIVAVDGDYFSKVNTAKVKRILKKLRSRSGRPDGSALAAATS